MSHLDPHHHVEENTILGFWIYLMTDAILFATLFATYAVLHNNTFGGPPAAVLLRPSHALVETLILLGGSFTTALAKGKLKRILFFYCLTFILGISFLLMVGDDFSRLIESGNGWQRNAFTASYFTLIGTHALHIIFGLLFIVVFLVQTVRWGLGAMMRRRLECLKLFWFFSYWIWIFMFSIVYLIGAAK